MHKRNHLAQLRIKFPISKVSTSSTPKKYTCLRPPNFLCVQAATFFSGSASHRAIPSSCLSHENSNPSRTQTLRAHTSPPSASLKPHNQSHALRPPKPAASSRASPQLRAHPLNCIHDVERPLRNRRLSLPHRRSVIRFHGARIPTRGFTVLME